MSGRRTRPPGMPPGYNAREGALWTQIQGLHQLAGRLHDRIVVLETLTARLLAQLRELRGVVEYHIPESRCGGGGDPAPPTSSVGEDPAPSSMDGADPAPRRRRKGGAA